MAIILILYTNKKLQKRKKNFRKKIKEIEAELRNLRAFCKNICEIYNTDIQEIFSKSHYWQVEKIENDLF